jgi:capsular exopolysaccharide synthesis family protein
MSRVDEALRRAKEAEAGAPAHVTPPEEGVFQPAWDVPGAEAPAPAAEGGGAVVRRFEPHGGAQEPGAAGADAPLLAGDGALALATFEGFHPQVTERLALPSNHNSGLVEQFRKLAATLHHAQTATGIKTVMITSAVAGEGKTLTATNLALTLAESFRRNVLLVDADLRRPSLHEVFQVPNVTGLSDGLKAATEGKLSLIQITPLLTLLTAGRPDPDPMHSLISERMKRVVEEARAKFDWVVLDTPPVGLLTDANLLAAMVDTALLVVRAGVAPYSYVERAAEIIGRDRIVGVVLNAVQPEHARGDDDYYSYYAYGRR